MKNYIPQPTSTEKPRKEASQSDDDSLITHWCGKYEGFLFKTAPYSTYERYSRVLSKFCSRFPPKQFTYEFLRADLEDYKLERLQEGASAKTVNIELSVLRGFWRFMLRMDTPGVMINPVRGVRVRKDSKKRKLVDWPTEGQNEANLVNR